MITESVDSKAVLAVISTIAGIGTLASRLKKQRAVIRGTPMRVGDLGVFYQRAIKWPTDVYLYALSIFTAFSCYVAFQGGWEAAVGTSILGLPSLLNYVVLLLFVNAVLTVFVYSSAPSKFVLFLTRKFSDQAAFDPGYINANRQAEEWEDAWVMNQDLRNCERLAISLVTVITQDTKPPRDMAATPAGLSQTEIANYILFGCVIEAYTNRIPGTDVKKMWDYLAAVSSLPAHPFAPEYIIAHSATGAFLEALLTLGKGKPIEGDLPSPPLMGPAVDQLVTSLIAIKGKADDLAYSVYSKRPSPKTLFEGLAMLQPFSNPELKHMKAQVLKLGIRMGVWPDMMPGPFVYAFNFGISLLLLNSGCILVSTKEIGVDEDFEHLVAKVEETVISLAFQHVRGRSTEEATSKWIETVFKTTAAGLEEWRFKDWLDTWLFSHTRAKCMKLTIQESASPCELKTDTNQCFCIGTKGMWKFVRGVLTRE